MDDIAAGLQIRAQSAASYTQHVAKVRQIAGTVSETKPTATPRKQTEEDFHNVQFIGARTTKLEWGGDTGGVLWNENVGESGDIYAVVACFRNEARYGSDIRPINDARAYLRLFADTGRELGTGFSGALWLGNRSDTYDLIPGGQAGCVIVIFGTSNEPRVPWKTRRPSWPGDICDDDTELEELPSIAEVSILDFKHRPLIPPVTLKIKKDGDAFAVTHVSSDASKV